VADLDELLSRMLSNALRENVAEEELRVAVETFRATVRRDLRTIARGCRPTPRPALRLDRLLGDPSEA
jgi:hypothetical protein